MELTPQTFALLSAGRPWAAYALGFAAAGAPFDVELDPSIPEALSVLRPASDRLSFKVVGDGLIEPGSWQLSVGPSGHPLPPAFPPDRCWTVAGDHGYWALVARWGDEPSSAELFQMWVRDELDHRSLGRLDRLLEDLVRAAVAPDDHETRVVFANPQANTAIETLLRTALPLRVAERERLAAEVRSIESRIDAGNEDADLLTAWDEAQLAADQLAFVSWEALLRDG